MLRPKGGSFQHVPQAQQQNETMLDIAGKFHGLVQNHELDSGLSVHWHPWIWHCKLGMPHSNWQIPALKTSRQVVTLQYDLDHCTSSGAGNLSQASRYMRARYSNQQWVALWRTRLIYRSYAFIVYVLLLWSLHSGKLGLIEAYLGKAYLLRSGLSTFFLFQNSSLRCMLWSLSFLCRLLRWSSFCDSTPELWGWRHKSSTGLLKL